MSSQDKIDYINLFDTCKVLAMDPILSLKMEDMGYEIRLEILYVHGSKVEEMEMTLIGTDIVLFMYEHYTEFFISTDNGEDGGIITNPFESTYYYDFKGTVESLLRKEKIDKII